MARSELPALGTSIPLTHFWASFRQTTSWIAKPKAVAASTQRCFPIETWGIQLTTTERSMDVVGFCVAPRHRRGSDHATRGFCLKSPTARSAQAGARFPLSPVPQLVRQEIPGHRLWCSDALRVHQRGPGARNCWAPRSRPCSSYSGRSEVERWLAEAVPVTGEALGGSSAAVRRCRATSPARHWAWPRGFPSGGELPLR